MNTIIGECGKKYMLFSHYFSYFFLYYSQLRQLLSEGIKDDELLQAIIKCRDDELEDIDLDNYGTHVQSVRTYDPQLLWKGSK